MLLVQKHAVLGWVLAGKSIKAQDLQHKLATGGAYWRGMNVEPQWCRKKTRPARHTQNLLADHASARQALQRISIQNVMKNSKVEEFAESAGQHGERGVTMHTVP